MVSEFEILLRVLIAAALGGLVGWERELQNHPAGLRTHIILVVGASLAAALSINLSMLFRPSGSGGDPARLAAQVITGVGFLGAGAILRDGVTVKGLTTAASLWTMAVVGLAVGTGYYFVGAGVTLLLLVVLTVLTWFEKRFTRPLISFSVVLNAVDRKNLVEEVQHVLTSGNRTLTSLSIRRDLQDKDIRLEVSVDTRDAASLTRITDELSTIKGVRSVKVG